jgi:hypothetical protein
MEQCDNLLIKNRTLDPGLRTLLTELGRTLVMNQSNRHKFIYELRSRLTPNVTNSLFEFHNHINELHVIDTLDRFFKHGNIDKMYYTLFRTKVRIVKQFSYNDRMSV